MAHLAMRANLSVRTPDRRAAGAFPLLALGLLPQVEMGLEQQPQQLAASRLDQVLQIVVGQRCRGGGGQLLGQAVEGPCGGGEPIDDGQGVVGFHHGSSWVRRSGWLPPKRERKAFTVTGIHRFHTVAGVGHREPSGLVLGQPPRSTSPFSFPRIPSIFPGTADSPIRGTICLACIASRRR
ncbi:hypothetical protein ABZY36_34485 [Streptomyces sp. NPDC006627]|uniref:hypothetical protein n=1 Tax=Streptomyces sp. NPDC006627 TaxID=3154679 RepID=UPI0033BE21C8